jgi:threonine dehydrogenase-like Zn-dependent dehydrogenase
MTTDTGDIVAAVQTGPGVIELRQFERPRIGADEALVRLEACGICGTDIDSYEGTSSPRYPVIRGHEPVGVVEEIGADAARRRGLRVGDRVAVDPFVPCARCAWCIDGNYEFCTGWDGRGRSYGAVSTDEPPGLWGGFATHLYIHPNTILYPVPHHVGPELATLYNPLGAGISWGVAAAGTTIGTTVLVLGCGQRGLCCALAARAAGAGVVAVTGLGIDAHKLRLATDLGVDAAIDVERHDLRQRTKELTAGVGFDVVVDTTPRATGPLVDAVDVARPGGRIVVGGLKGRSLDGFPIDRATLNALTIRGVRGVGAASYRRAIELIAAARFPLDRLRTHVFSLDQVERAILVLRGDNPAERAINVVVTP